jgi:hypothetical protein
VSFLGGLGGAITGLLGGGGGSSSSTSSNTSNTDARAVTDNSRTTTTTTVTDGGAIAGAVRVAQSATDAARSQALASAAQAQALIASQGRFATDALRVIAANQSELAGSRWLVLGSLCAVVGVVWVTRGRG